MDLVCAQGGIEEQPVQKWSLDIDKNVVLPKANYINGNLFKSFNRLCLTLPKPDIGLILYFWDNVFICSGELEGSHNTKSEKQTSMYQSWNKNPCEIFLKRESYNFFLILKGEIFHNTWILIVPQYILLILYCQQCKINWTFKLTQKSLRKSLASWLRTYSTRCAFCGMAGWHYNLLREINNYI